MGLHQGCLLARKALSRNIRRDTKHKMCTCLSLTWKTLCAKTIIPLSYKQYATDSRVKTQTRINKILCSNFNITIRTFIT